MRISALAFELAALHPRHGGMQAECIAHQIDLAVVQHLVDWRAVAHESGFQFADVLIQRLVGLDRVPLRVLLRDVRAEPAIMQQLQCLALQRFGIGAQVDQFGHGQLNRQSGL